MTGKSYLILSYATRSRNKMSCWWGLPRCSIFQRPIQDPGAKLNHMLRIFPREFKGFLQEPDYKHCSWCVAGNELPNQILTAETLETKKCTLTSWPVEKMDGYASEFKAIFGVTGSSRRISSLDCLSSQECVQLEPSHLPWQCPPLVHINDRNVNFFLPK